jgi:hypothetical protein
MKVKTACSSKEFDANDQKILADSDLGSWFSQEKQWPGQYVLQQQQEQAPVRKS